MVSQLLVYQRVRLCANLPWFDLERGIEQLQRQVGGLSETVGGDIEDIAHIILHDVLRREFGWQVGVLERTWQTWNNEIEEIDVFGSALDPARPEQTIWIVGEAEQNLTAREVERFVRKVEYARQHLTGEVFAVCFCYRARWKCNNESGLLAMACFLLWEVGVRGRKWHSSDSSNE